jgi:hypothetical protein
MPLDDDASPFERHAAEQERSSRSSRKSRTRSHVNEHIFAGAVTVTIQGVAIWLSGNRRARSSASQAISVGRDRAGDSSRGKASQVQIVVVARRRKAQQ